MKELTKKKRRHLDPSKINQEKHNFSSGILYHFDNLTKKTKSASEMNGKNDLTEAKSIVYQRKSNNRKANEDLLHYTK